MGYKTSSTDMYIFFYAEIVVWKTDTLCETQSYLVSMEDKKLFDHLTNEMHLHGGAPQGINAVGVGSSEFGLW